MTIKDSIHGWSTEDLCNLWFILTDKADAPFDKNAFVKVFVWRYYSRPWAEFEAIMRNWGKTGEVFRSPEDIRDEPTFDQLVHAAARSRGIREYDATLSQLGRYISQRLLL